MKLTKRSVTKENEKSTICMGRMPLGELDRSAPYSSFLFTTATFVIELSDANLFGRITVEDREDFLIFSREATSKDFLVVSVLSVDRVSEGELSKQTSMIWATWETF